MPQTGSTKGVKSRRNGRAKGARGMAPHEGEGWRLWHQPGLSDRKHRSIPCPGEGLVPGQRRGGHLLSHILEWPLPLFPSPLPCCGRPASRVPAQNPPSGCGPQALRVLGEYMNLPP